MFILPKEASFMPWRNSVYNEVDRIHTARGGDGLHYLPEKANANGNPLLLIGLGGTGLRIVKEAAAQMSRYFEPSPMPFPGTNEMLPAKTRILAIDTDEIGLRDSSLRPAEYCSIGCRNIADILTGERRQELPDYILDWLNPELLPNVPHTISGALAIRQLGRLSFFIKIAQAANAIRTALGQLGNHQPAYIYVVIAAGSTGGTGSALFLDTAFLVRHIAAELGVRVYIAGLLTLPDVHCCVSPESATALKANGYACLKELDYWMGAADDEPYQQRYSPSLAISVSDRPFDDCYLAGGPNFFSDRLDLNHLCRTAAECILNMHCFVQRASMSGYLSWRGSIKAHLQHAQLPADACKCYTAVGVCCAQLPLDKLLMAEGALLFREAGKARDAANACSLPDEQEYGLFVQQIVDGCADELLDAIPDPVAAFPTFQEIRSSASCAPHDPSIDPAIASYYAEMQKRAEGPHAQAAIERCVRQLSERLTAMFADPAKGPFYTGRFIGSAEAHEHGLTAVLQVLLSSAHIQRTNAMQTHHNAAEKAREDYETLKTSLFASLKRSTFSRYANNCRDAHHAMLEYHRQSFLCCLMEKLLEKANELYSQVIQPLCFALTELIKAFGEMEGLPVQPDPSPFCINAVDPQLIIQRLEETQTSPQQLDCLLETLYTDMIRPCDGVIAGQWLVRDAQGRTDRFAHFRDHLERILSDFFLPFNSQTLTSFWQLQYPNALLPNGSVSLSAIVPQLLSTMQSLAEPLFIPNPIFPFRNNPAVLCSNFVAVPPYMAGHGSLGNQPVSATDLPERLFILNAVDGVSLYHYDMLHSCEQAYLQTVLKGMFPGCHLWENRINWKALPNPMPRGVRPHGYHNPVQQAADEAFLSRIDALIKDGWISFDTVALMIRLYSNTQLTRELAQTLLDKLNAGAIPDHMAQIHYEQVLESRCLTGLFLRQSALNHYRSLERVEDPFRSLAEDMLMRMPAKIASLEKDAEELAELVRAIQKCSQKADEKHLLLQMAPRMADLFAFGILTRPTPMLVSYSMDDAPPQTVYNSIKDNAKYTARYHAIYTRLVCIAAKLVDMEDPSHEEHDKLLQLKTLEERLANDLKDGAMELSAGRLAAFTANAQPLKTELASVHNAVQLASPAALRMTTDDKWLYLDFLREMMDALDARATAFGMMLT